MYGLFFFSEPLTESDINNILLSRAELGIGTDPIQNFNLNEVSIIESEFDPILNQSVDFQKNSHQTNMEDSSLIASKPITTMRLSAIPVVGSSKDEISLDFENDFLIISGKQPEPRKDGLSRYRIREFSKTGFKRHPVWVHKLTSIKLPLGWTMEF